MESWLEPPEDDFYMESRIVYIEFGKNDIVEIENGDIVSFPKFEDYEDWEFRFVVVSGEELSELTLEALYDYFPTDDEGYYIDGRYRLSGEAELPYDVAVPVYRPQLHSYYSEELDEIFEDEEPEFYFELGSKVDVSNIKITRI